MHVPVDPLAPAVIITQRHSGTTSILFRRRFQKFLDGDMQLFSFLFSFSEALHYLH
jgi:hypothetical protein